MSAVATETKTQTPAGAGVDLKTDAGQAPEAMTKFQVAKANHEIKNNSEYGRELLGKAMNATANFIGSVVGAIAQAPSYFSAAKEAIAEHFREKRVNELNSSYSTEFKSAVTQIVNSEIPRDSQEILVRDIRSQYVGIGDKMKAAIAQAGEDGHRLEVSKAKEFAAQLTKVIEDAKALIAQHQMVAEVTRENKLSEDKIGSLIVNSDLSIARKKSLGEIYDTARTALSKDLELARADGTITIDERLNAEVRYSMNLRKVEAQIDRIIDREEGVDAKNAVKREALQKQLEAMDAGDVARTAKAKEMVLGSLGIDTTPKA